MKTNIEIYTSEIFGEIRTCQVNNQIMFVGKDVAQALGYAKPQNALATHVDEEDRTTAPIQGTGSNYITRVTIINNAVLCDMGIQYRSEGHWNLVAELQGRGYTALRTHVSYSLKGVKKIRTYMTWTIAGLHYLNAKLGYPNF